MNILVINAGSSSLKYQLIEMIKQEVVAKGAVERIGIEGSILTHKPEGKDKVVIKQEMPDHKVAIQLVLHALTDKEHGVLASMDEISAVGHRVVHGAEFFSGSVVITDEVIAALKECSELAPLHNPANLMGIEACRSIIPNVPMVGVFDTAFHQTMPKKAYLYAVPKEYYTRLKVRRYGFHGTSHRYVSKRAAEYLGLSEKGLRVITCHLGNGSSLAAVKDGKCIDTSMGITPLEGVIMGTRSGSLDPAVVQFIANNDHKTVDEVLDMLNKKSGLVGLSGISSDMRDIDAAAANGNEDAITAREMLVYGIRKYIGSYAAAMNGVDVIVFTAGIGENNINLRRMVMEGFEFLGAKLDVEKNNTREEAVISTDDSRVKIVVIPTNEEIVIARDTLELVSAK